MTRDQNYFSGGEQALNLSSENVITASAGNSDITTATQTTLGNLWSSPERVEVNEYPDCIEMIYKQTSQIQLAVYPSRAPEERVYKIIFSCQNGKWHKSEPIFGQIITAQKEWYDFEPFPDKSPR